MALALLVGVLFRPVGMAVGENGRWGLIFPRMGRTQARQTFSRPLTDPATGEDWELRFWILDRLRTLPERKGPGF